MRPIRFLDADGNNFRLKPGKTWVHIVMTGNLTTIPYCRTVMEKLNEMFDVHFLIPDLATYGTVIGTALRG